MAGVAARNTRRECSYLRNGSESVKSVKRLNNSDGFTLVELMIVVALLAILLVVSGPALSGFLPKYRVDSAMRSVGSRMSLLRLQAINENRHIRATFTNAKTINLDYVDMTSGNPVHEADLPDPTITFVDSNSDYDNVTIGRNTSDEKVPNSPNTDLAKPVGFGRNADNFVVFRPNGTTSATGEIFLAPVQVIGNLDPIKNKMQRAVQVSMAGMITLYRYDPTNSAGAKWEAL